MLRHMIFGALLLSGGAVAFGQSGGEGRGPGDRRGFGPPPNPIFDALDVDRDGVISAQELEGAVAALKKLDTNGDGKITREEVRPQFPSREEGSSRGGEGSPFNAEAMVARMMERDANKDGKLNAEELGERGARMLETGDKDGDGALNEEELKAIFSRFGGGSGRPGGGRRGGEGGERPRRPAPEGTSTNDRI